MSSFHEVRYQLFSFIIKSSGSPWVIDIVGKEISYDKTIIQIFSKSWKNKLYKRVDSRKQGNQDNRISRLSHTHTHLTFLITISLGTDEVKDSLTHIHSLAVICNAS